MNTADRLFDALVADLVREAGSDAPRLAAERAEMPWLQRGVSEAIRTIGLQEQDARAGMVFGAAFERGALHALRLARVVLSDPSVRGSELDALTMIELGASHAEVLAKLKHKGNSTGEKSGRSNVVPLVR